MESQIINGREYREVKTWGYRSVANGRSTIKIECPFCFAVVTGYVWSLCGSGKKCNCGALLGTRGAFAPEIKKK